MHFTIQFALIQFLKTTVGFYRYREERNMTKMLPKVIITTNYINVVRWPRYARDGFSYVLEITCTHLYYSYLNQLLKNLKSIYSRALE